MPVFETYASRVAAAAKAGSPDVYIYDELRPLVRKQLSIIFTQCIGPGWREPRGFVPGTDAVPQNANEIWERVARVMVERWSHSLCLETPRKLEGHRPRKVCATG